MKKLSSLAIVFVFSLSLISAEETSYTNYSFARLSYVAGNIYIQRAADLGYEEGVVNMPVSEGDRLGTTDGRAEIYLGKSNYLRLDHNTKIDFLNLPKRGYDLIKIRVWSGNIYFNVNFLEKEKNIEIHTSDVSIYVLDKGLYRIDVRENNETEIFVFQGLVEAAGEEGSVLIKNEQRLKVTKGHFTSRPAHFYAAADDSFDRWSEYRDSQINKRVARRYLPEELEDFEYELANHGYWAYLRPYGYVWVPRGLTPGWRPYYHGRWVWLPLCGWTWLSSEPWGWCAYHYGRWHWSIGLGWYWIPTTIWGPGWVNWYWGYDYFGWAPLSYYGYPVVIIGDVFYPRYWDRYYPYNSRALTVIHKNQLRARNVSKDALSQDSIKKLGKISLSKKSPIPKPVANKVTVEKLGDKKFILKKEYKSSKVFGRNLERSSIRKPVSPDSKKIEERGSRSFKLPQSKEKAVVKGKTKEKVEVKKKVSEEKKVEKKDRGFIKEKTYGYPPSPKISLKNVPKIDSTSKSSSFLSRIYKHISGSSASKYIKGSTSRSTSKGVSSRSTSLRSRSGSKSSSSGRSSSSSKGSGKVKKK